VVTTLHTQRRERRYRHGTVHQPATSPVTLRYRLAPGHRRRIPARIRALDQLAALVRKRPYGGRSAA
jgi:hypothetical protein